MARKFTFTTQVYDKKTDFPRVGDVDVIYIDASTNKAYRYDESYYKISSADVNVWGALGSVSKGGGGASWGSITGTLSSQTDLQAALSGKQDTLVSGTNIKTINGSSVLGSGDLTISGGSGLKGVHNVNGYFDLTSQGISAQLNASSTSAVIMAANQMYAYPFIPNNTITSVSLKINVTTLGVGVNCRILIYSSVSGVPTTKLYESANLDCSTVGVKTATTSFTFTAGTTYWLCLQSSGTTSLSGIQPAALIPLAMVTSPSSAPMVAYINTSTFGSAPTTFVINNRTNTSVPLVGIYLS